MHESGRNACPRCSAERLRAWHELSDEEREVVRRLPTATAQSLAERTARHRWCVRCWHEAAETVRQG